MSAEDISNAILKVVACANGFVDKQQAQAKEDAGLFAIDPLFMPAGFLELVRAVRAYRNAIGEKPHATC